MNQDRKRHGTHDEHILYLDENTGDDVTRALEDAARAVAAVEEKHRQQQEGGRSPAAEAVPAPAAEIEFVSEAPEEEAPQLPSERVLSLERDLVILKERAIAAEEEAGRLREALLRKAADFDNLKKRTEREKADYTKFAMTEVLREFLHVLDNLERAMAHAATSGPVSVDDFRVGIDMIMRQFGEALKRFGVVEVAAQGQHFNPNFHQAMTAQESDEVPPNTVLSVLQKGYTLNERLLRPAMVTVSVARSRSAEAASSEHSEQNGPKGE